MELLTFGWDHRVIACNNPAGSKLAEEDRVRRNSTG
jgi:hypothetical protein